MVESSGLQYFGAMKDFISVIRQDNAVTMRLVGFVGNDFSPFNFEYLSSLFREYAGERINLELFSAGGKLVEAFAIADYIRAHNLDVYTYIYGICGSAATVVSLASRETYIGRNSLFFIHKSSNPLGEEDEFNEMLDAMMLAVYREKTNQDESTIREWMNQETFFRSEEAVALGFVDDVINDENIMAMAASAFALDSQISTSKRPSMDLLAEIKRKFPEFQGDTASEALAFMDTLKGDSGSGTQPPAQQQQGNQNAHERPTDTNSELAEEIKGLKSNLVTLAQGLTTLTGVVKNIKSGNQQAPAPNPEPEPDPYAEQLALLKNEINALKGAPQSNPPAANGSAHAKGLGDQNAASGQEHEGKGPGYDEPWKVDDGVFVSAHEMRRMGRINRN